MSTDPLLVLQLQRMGDLILTFPLLLEMQRRFPSNPLWVVADPLFFKGLMNLAPNVTFFSPTHCEVLARNHYELAVNLSNRADATACLGRLSARRKLGPRMGQDCLRVDGFWHLYRLALTHNNRHNLFHWADLYRMDMDADIRGSRTAHAKPHPPQAGRRIALVPGASEAAKRPDVAFWAELARRLARNGFAPLFIGGPSEAELGAEAARRCDLPPQANLCGKLSLFQTACCLRETDLCITPDTGPMHLADWLGTPVLNLSMGPVRAWETGPVSPGQWVLRASISCSGCWKCRRPHLPCKKNFTPAQVARVALALLENTRKPNLTSDVLHGLDLLRTGRDSYGLYTLTPVDRTDGERTTCKAQAQTLLDAFWKTTFLALYQPELKADLPPHVIALAAHAPALFAHLRRDLTRFCRECMSPGASSRAADARSADFWLRRPPSLRLFAGHTQMFLQNADFSPEARRALAERMEMLLSCLTS
ncbi:MAG: glycosyltransferase family 9 protein [Desulfovibrio sp.]|nr:glycosyltransferase family 9 protein [Desulfovibrio sp.]